MRRTLLLFVCLLAPIAIAQTPDLTKEPTLYVVGYAHLDTQWRWEYPQTIAEYLPNTMRDNFALFEKYPRYTFNFSGANRYRLMREYFPADYARLRQYVKAGRWFPAGSSMEESDVNSPSAESILRQVLYGNQFFRRDLGRASAEFMLPDCFGFPSSLPSLLAHAGIKGFSTQKLTWGSAVGVPFNLGVWEGPDGATILAALNPGDYTGSIDYDISRSDPAPEARTFVDWPKRVQSNGETGGLFADYHYYGTGDVGGAPDEASVKMLETILAGNGPLRVVSSTAEQMFLDIKPAQTARLPRYKGELELTEHSAGSLTSQAYQKRWNRKNELLAEAAEKASVTAEWLGARRYPRQRLNDAWTLVMGGQFHDIQAGTATPKSYQYSWNDDVLAMNQFAGVLTSAVEGVAAALDTRAEGTAIVVYNPLNVEREDIVEARLPIAAPVRVFGPGGVEVPAQVSGDKVIFLARVPSVGYAVYDVRGGQTGLSVLHVDASSLENARYRVRLDPNGDVASIFDKTSRKELLSGPAQLAFQTEKPRNWPAWNMDWADQQKPPRRYVEGPANIQIVENGPARVALRVERNGEGSKFVQTIRLAAGDAGNRVEFDTVIDWYSREAALKATFPLTASNPQATYNWDVGTILRGNNDPKKYEVASHQWFDLTDKSGTYGVTILSDCKYGSDKPADNLLRLTLVYTPAVEEGGGRWLYDEITQDWGHHEFIYGLAAHGGSWSQDQTDWQAQRLNQPLIAFEAPQHAGSLGRSFSLLQVSNSRVRVLALKKAEESDEVIVRLVELDGKPAADVRLKFAAPLTAAREVNGQEMRAGSATIRNSDLVTSLTPYQIRTFAVKLAAAPKKVASPIWQAVALATDQSVATNDGAASTAGFDGAGRNLPAEMLPAKIEYGPVQFSVAPKAMTPRGQTIDLPAGRRLYVLAASAAGDQKATFRPGDTAVDVMIPEWTGFIGQWDRRTFTNAEEPLLPRPARDTPPGTPPPAPKTRKLMVYSGMIPGFIKSAPVAWFASHRHAPDGQNEPYAYSYLFAQAMDIPAGARRLTLPDNDKIRILAITVSDEGAPVRPVQPLYDTLER